VKVSSRLKGISPNSARNTSHKGYSQLVTEQSTQMRQSQKQGKITKTTLTDRSEMGVMVDIASFMRKVYLMSDRVVDIDSDNINNICNTLTIRFI